MRSVCSRAGTKPGIGQPFPYNHAAGRVSAAYRADGLDGGELGAFPLALGVDPVQAALVLLAALTEAARHRTGLCLLTRSALIVRAQTDGTA